MLALEGRCAEDIVGGGKMTHGQLDGLCYGARELSGSENTEQPVSSRPSPCLLRCLCESPLAEELGPGYLYGWRETLSVGHRSVLRSVVERPIVDSE